MNSYTLEPVGFIRSTVKGREDAPRQGPEGAPDAWLEIEPQFADALLGIEVGHELIVISGCTRLGVMCSRTIRAVTKAVRSPESFTRAHPHDRTHSDCIP